MNQDREQIERKNKRTSWLITLSIQGVLFLLLYFIIAWKAPFPPIPEYGIELGFEYSESGSPAPVDATEEELPEEDVQQPEEAEEPAPEENDQETTETEQVAVSEEVEEVSDEPEEPVETQPVESITEPPATTQEETEETVEAEKATQADAEEKQVEEADEAAEQVEEESPPAIDQRAIYSGTEGNSEGPDEGASLALAGWIWDFKPSPEDDSNETGKIVYQIVVDDEGYLVKITTLTSTVSPAVERKYRQAVEKLTFSKTSDYSPAPLSTGTLTFVIKTK